MNEVSLKAEENKENPLDLALEKLEHMKIRLMQKVKKAEGQRASISKNQNYDLESVKTKQYSSILWCSRSRFYEMKWIDKYEK